MLLLSSWLQLMLVGCSPRGAVGTGSSQHRVGCPSALGDAASSDLPLEGSRSLPSKAPDPTTSTKPFLPAHHPRLFSLELSSLCGPHPQETQLCPSVPLTSSPQPHEQFPPPGAHSAGWGSHGHTLGSGLDHGGDA